MNARAFIEQGIQWEEINMDYWMAVLGGAILTFLLTRLCLYILKRTKIESKIAPIIAAGVVFLLCLIVYNGNPVMAIVIYLPSIVVWLLIDLIRVNKYGGVNKTNST